MSVFTNVILYTLRNVTYTIHKESYILQIEVAFMAKNIRLKVARTEKEMSQQQLADAVEVTRQTISAIERGDYNPTINLCINICKALGVTLNDLFWEG